MLETPVNPTVAAVLVRSDRFFVRRVSLAPEGEPAIQVELALEQASPFPLEQLYHGYVIAEAGDEALVYAAYRRQFAEEETAAWNTAPLVVPAFVALLGNPPDRALIQVWRDGEEATVVAWDGKSRLPAGVLFPAAGDESMLVGELRERTGLAKAPVDEIAGAAEACRDEREGLVIKIGSGAQSAIKAASVAHADIRERGFLAERERTGQRDRKLWRVFFGGVAALAALLLLELGLFSASLFLQKQRTGVAERAPAVEKIEAAHHLSARVQELSQRQLRPFEMMVLLNRLRPASILFIRATMTGPQGIEVEAQTANAGDAGSYEAALRAAPQFATVETRDLRSRDGVTTFTVAVSLKPDAFAPDSVR